MTDRSSQPCSSNNESHSVKTSSIDKGTRRFTITVSKKSPQSDSVIDNKKTPQATKLQDVDAHELKTDKQLSSKNVEINKPLEPIIYPDEHKPAVIHANFDPSRTPINPARPLTDFPEPAPRQLEVISSVLYKRDTNNLNKKVSEADFFASSQEQQGHNLINDQNQSKETKLTWGEQLSDHANKSVSKWDLIKSTELAEHLDLLKAGNLARFPRSFYHNSSNQSLLRSLEKLQLVDIAQMRNILDNHPQLTRHGFKPSSTLKSNPNNDNLEQVVDLANIDLAEDWEAILYPERFDQFDKSMGHLSMDIMAVSIAVHVLSQCPTRQSSNAKITATKIVQHLRSYLLSQCQQLPHMREQLTHTPIYQGHVILASQLLGWHMETVDAKVDTTDIANNKSVKTNSNIEKQVIFNVSSRCGLFVRYPDLTEYFINGWT